MCGQLVKMGIAFMCLVRELCATTTEICCTSVSTSVKTCIASDEFKLVVSGCVFFWGLSSILHYNSLKRTETCTVLLFNYDVDLRVQLRLNVDLMAVGQRELHIQTGTVVRRTSTPRK